MASAPGASPTPSVVASESSGTPASASVPAGSPPTAAASSATPPASVSATAWAASALAASAPRSKVSPPVPASDESTSTTKSLASVDPPGTSMTGSGTGEDGEEYSSEPAGLETATVPKPASRDRAAALGDPGATVGSGTSSAHIPSSSAPASVCGRSPDAPESNACSTCASCRGSDIAASPGCGCEAKCSGAVLEIGPDEKQDAGCAFAEAGVVAGIATSCDTKRGAAPAVAVAAGGRRGRGSHLERTVPELRHMRPQLPEPARAPAAPCAPSHEAAPSPPILPPPALAPPHPLTRAERVGAGIWRGHSSRTPWRCTCLPTRRGLVLACSACSACSGGGRHHRQADVGGVRQSGQRQRAGVVLKRAREQRRRTVVAAFGSTSDARYWLHSGTGDIAAIAATTAAVLAAVAAAVAVVAAVLAAVAAVAATAGLVKLDGRRFTGGRRHDGRHSTPLRTAKGHRRTKPHRQAAGLRRHKLLGVRVRVGIGGPNLGSLGVGRTCAPPCGIGAISGHARKCAVASTPRIARRNPFRFLSASLASR
eukprot:scaffold4345_cov92-Isochrysis_galbana.AAC.3